MPLELIDKQDNFEIIRDQIAAILVTETVNQKALASAASKDPAEWDLRIYSEAFNPWEQWLNDESNDQRPIVNVWFDNQDFDKAGSNTFERQKSNATYNIDIYGRGISADVAGGGHVPGDRDAALTVQRGARLVRNILMAAENTYLGLRGLVWQRWPSSTTIYQPQIDGRPVIHVMAARFAFGVQFNEFSPQVVPETLELISVDVLEDGEIVINADYDYTA